jgi:small subunit ribosomal protein S1
MIEQEIATSEAEVYGLSEEWWEAVLMDEEAQMSDEDDITPKDCAVGTQELYNTNWTRVELAHRQDQILTVMVIGMNNHGLIVCGQQMRGFLPASHLVGLKRHALLRERRLALAQYLGRELKVKILMCEPCSDRLLFSERAALAQPGKRIELFETISEGMVVEGVVTNITYFGAFVDLGGLEGLLHLSEISWGRVQHPSHVLQVGQQLQLVVVAVNKQNGRVSLSLKRMFPNPWEVVAQKYCIGDVVMANVTGVTEYGVFVRLPEGVDGLIHVSSIDDFRARCSTWQPLHPGQSVQVSILALDAERRRLGLALVCVQ